MVVSVLMPAADEGASSVRFGIVVGKKEIPLATARNRVKRRLRHLLRAKAGELPQGTRVVVRALRASSEMDSAIMGAHLNSLLSSALKKESSRRARAGSAPSSAAHTPAADPVSSGQ